MWPASTSFVTALARPHTVTLRANAYRGTTDLGDLVVAGGSVRVDAASATRRALQGLVVPSPDGRTSTLRRLIDTETCEIQIWRGIRYPTGRIEEIPLGRFRVDTLTDTLGQPGSITIDGSDRIARVVDDRFLAPRSAASGITIIAQITRLVQESIPGVPVLDETGDPTIVRSGVVWDRDRWGAVTDLATSIGAIVWADPTGSIRISRAPTLADPATWMVDDTIRGVVVDGRRSTTRAGVRNVIVASSAPTDGSAPITAIAQDNDPTSPTRVGGPFGRVPGFYSSPLLTSQAQAATAAAAILGRSIGRRRTLSLDLAVNPALDAGDRLDVLITGDPWQRHIVDNFTVPLDVDGAMSIDTRAAQDTEEAA